MARTQGQRIPEERCAYSEPYCDDSDPGYYGSSWFFCNAPYSTPTPQGGPPPAGYSSINPCGSGS